VSIHHEAMFHLDKAVRQAASDDVDSLRYAALNLRDSIECLAFELVPLYKAELPDEVLEAWRPQEILAALLDCNPSLPHSSILSLAAEDADGNPKKWMTMGRSSGLVPSVLSSSNHRLGSFLHARPDGQPHDLKKLRRSVKKVADVLERYRNDSVIDTLGKKHIFPCECGREVVRREEALRISPFVRCPNKNCRAMYERVNAQAGGSEFAPLQEEFVCPGCKEKSYFGRHLLKEGNGLRCPGCSDVWLLEARLILVRP
jgi:DNA-directed RNA polymerase subunit RPC12/RpoP